MSLKITAFEKLSFEDAVRILHFHFWEKPARLEEHLSDLIDRSDKPNEAVTRVWYDQYRQVHQENHDQK